MYDAMRKAMIKIRQNAQQGHRTLLVCFYAGHGATVLYKTEALLNSNQQGNDRKQYELEYELRECAKLNGVYVIGLFACDRAPMPVEAKRGGTKGEQISPKPI